jgi:pyruvate formate lyase activating enzyme
VHWYRDPLPTNCVADFFCEGNRQRGKHNLAVFYGACTLSCLFCQNWSFRTLTPRRSSDLLSAEELAGVANDRTHCICYFGGDPSAQLPHALATSRRLARRGVAICFETNGLGHPALMRTAAELARESGGTVKLDLKAFDPTLHRALTSADNARVLENLRALAPLLLTDDGPRLCAATLLVPGYVDVQEVEGIARLLAEVDPRIPYSLLAFHPQFAMTDLPQTSWAHAEAAERAARAAGLAQVRVGNIHLLSRGYGVDEPW